MSFIDNQTQASEEENLEEKIEEIDRNLSPNDTSTEQMDPWRKYAKKLIDRVDAYFDVEEDVTWKGLAFDFVGTMLRRNEKFVLQKKNVLYAYNEFEYFFLYQKERMNLDELEQLVKQFSDLAKEHVDPDEEHKTSDYCLIVHTKQADEEMRRYVKKYKDRTALQWGVKGFLSTRVILVEDFGKTASFSKELRGKSYRFVLDENKE